MKVIVCGAGQVGFNIARFLANEQNDVTVIDQSEELIRKIGESLDIKGITGFASHPDVLDAAGAADTDMLIAVTASDEVNMVACQVCHSLFNVPTKIARIRHQGYLKSMWGDLFSRESLPIDVIISPEIEVARAICRRLQVPGASDVIPFADGRVHLIGVKCGDNCPIVNTPLDQLTELFPDLTVRVVAIVRENRIIAATRRDQIMPGDEVYFIADRDHVRRTMPIFGHEESEARRIVIIGGGNIGVFLARELSKSEHSLNLKIIEANKSRAEQIADGLGDVMVLNGDALDPEILLEANIGNTETVVSVSNDDQVNILSALLAKRNGCGRAVALINNATFTPLIASLGIDVTVNPRETTASRILQQVRRGRIRSVYSIREGAAEVIEADALETSPLVGQSLREANLPHGIVVGAIMRGDEVIAPTGDTVIKAGDRVVIFALADYVRKVEKLFSVRLEFF